MDTVEITPTLVNVKMAGEVIYVMNLFASKSLVITVKVLDF